MPAPASRKRRIARDAALHLCLLSGLLALFLTLAGTIAPTEAAVGALAASGAWGAMRLAHDPGVEPADRHGRPMLAAARLVAGTLRATARDCVLVAATIARGLLAGRAPAGRFEAVLGDARPLDILRHSLPPNTYIVATREEGMLGHRLAAPPATRHGSPEEGASP